MTGENNKGNILYPLDFKIEIITGSGDEANVDFEQLFKLRALTEEHKITCKVRAFDSSNDADSNLIRKLPCVYILGRGNGVQEVLYPDDKLISSVKIHLLRCKDKYEETQRKKAEWDSRISSLTKIFWSSKKLTSSK